MKITKYIQTIQIHLIKTHASIFDWFDEEEALQSYRPVDNGWTILEILEHIALTSHFLMKLVDKGTNKALRNIKNLSLESLLTAFDYDLAKFDKIGIHKSFDWIRPEHMEPKGTKSQLEIRQEMIDQISNCLVLLEKMKEGQGLQYKTMMSVNNLGKLNVYEYVYFLSKHAERHLQQMKENKIEFIGRYNGNN